MKDSIQSAFQAAIQTIQQFVDEEENLIKIENISKDIAATFAEGNKIILCGNGGSNADAIHFAEECTGRFRKNRKALPAMAISDSSHITCTANDYGFDEIFARGVEAYGQPGDFFIGISTSGNSQNVLNAFIKAQEKNLKTFALLGKTGGKIKGIASHEIIIPALTTDRIQELHMTILHVLIEQIERRLFPENY